MASGGEENMIISLDSKFNGGLGDAVWFSWLGMGSRETNNPICFFTKDAQKRLLLSMLGQYTSQYEKRSIDTTIAYQNELNDFGTKPRYRYVLDWLKRDDIVPVRPSVDISICDTEWATESIAPARDGKKFVLLFPQSKSAPRQWPLAYWLDLAHEFYNNGVFVAASFTGATDRHQERWPAYVQDVPLERMAALMKMADLVIGNDSFPVHLSSTIGTPTLVLMGPTKPEVVFGHMGEQAPFCIDSNYECTGCSWRQPIYRHACFEQCRSLMMLKPETVKAAACDILQTVHATA